MFAATGAVTGTPAFTFVSLLFPESLGLAIALELVLLSVLATSLVNTAAFFPFLTLDPFVTLGTEISGTGLFTAATAIDAPDVLLLSLAVESVEAAAAFGILPPFKSSISFCASG